MADKKKMSIAEILAAARKSDGQGGGGEEAAPPPVEAPDESAAAPARPTPAKPAAKPAAKGAGRPGVADILAAARAEKQAPAAAAKPAPAKPAPAAKKAAPASKPTAPAKAGAKQPSGPRDTASILAAARKEERPGPVSKAEAAKRAAGKPAPPKRELPPMPVKPNYAVRAADTPPKPAPGADRRGFLTIGFSALAAVGGLWTLAATRFMFPNVLREPPSRFKVGFPGDFAPGQVATKFKAQFGVWVVNTEFAGLPQIFALKSVCTHLGCTPNWLEAEQKFKCPCHGSGFYKDGVNFEGPAPRPLERYAIQIADDGQVEIDKSFTFQEEMGQWEDPQSFIPM